MSDKPGAGVVQLTRSMLTRRRSPRGRRRRAGIKLLRQLSLALALALVAAAVVDWNYFSQVLPLRFGSAWVDARRGLGLAGEDGTNPIRGRQPAEADLVGVASVIDGDTIEIHGQRIRLYGIDAPESRQTCLDAGGRAWRCGQRAALALQDLIGRRTVSCDERDVDRYGRIVGRCVVGDMDINEWLVTQGLALAYRHYSMDYIAAEDEARSAGRGMWAGPFEPPWDWRHRH